MDAAARVHRAAFDAAFPWLTGLHTRDEDRWFYRERVFRECELWGAFHGDPLTGIIAFREGWIDQLYVHPNAQGRGIGSSLLDIAKAASRGLKLWTFQRNLAARRFYEMRGFVAVCQTDGSRNEENEPDILYQWSSDPRADHVI
ncbi:GNAT family N-acetyltransferase [Bradyrhizobium sp. STM 3843]|uniref:GNAT family N-acetyltransferase n=1 Tax=Bradyrhizobium sp. STM 3843 TaxID=551947 RepID=UPI001FCA7814|nr:GNAT family N-acetyltransferase [Bradyrhizobium sp. STM 3843]